MKILSGEFSIPLWEISRSCFEREILEPASRNSLDPSSRENFSNPLWEIPSIPLRKRISPTRFERFSWSLFEREGENSLNPSSRENFSIPLRERISQSRFEREFLEPPAQGIRPAVLLFSVRILWWHYPSAKVYRDRFISGIYIKCNAKRSFASSTFSTPSSSNILKSV